MIGLRARIEPADILQPLLRDTPKSGGEARGAASPPRFGAQAKDGGRSAGAAPKAGFGFAPMRKLSVPPWARSA
jgi:hypothetical protein